MAAQRYQITTLLYCFNERGETLLMQRLKEPNLGLWSPAGGKLDIASGESPHECAAREAAEEIGIQVSASDLHLTGIITETGAAGHDHWLMFLFEALRPVQALPPAHREGRFEFFSREQLDQLDLPRTDREQIWPLFWKHRGGFFAARCQVAAVSRPPSPSAPGAFSHPSPAPPNEFSHTWTLQESRIAR